MRVKDYFCPISVEKKIIEFIINNTSIQRCSLMSKLQHKKNEEAAMLLLGFNSLDKILLRIKTFFTDANASNFLKMSIIKKIITIISSKLTDLEEIIIVKIIMQFFCTELNYHAYQMYLVNAFLTRYRSRCLYRHLIDLTYLVL